MKKLSLVVILTLFAFLPAFSANTSKSEETTNNKNVVKSSKKSTSNKKTKNKGNKKQNNIANATEKEKNLSTLASLLSQAGLITTFQNEDHLTLFAPSDAAFKNLESQDPATYAYITNKSNKKDLQDLLKFHTLPKEKSTELITTKINKSKNKQIRLKTLNEPHRIIATLKDGNIYLKRIAKVNKSSIQASNGTIHTIDHVLIPSWLRRKINGTNKTTSKHKPNKTITKNSNLNGKTKSVTK